MSEAPEKSSRRWVTLFCWSLAGLFAFVVFLRILGLESGLFPVVQLIAYTPYVLLLAIPSLIAVALLRRWPQAGILAGVVLVLAVLVLPRWSGGTEEIEGGRQVRVLTANLAKGKADPHALLRLAETRDADILFLQEVSAWKARQLNRVGFRDAYPHQALDVTEGNGGQAVFARWPLEQLDSLPAGRQPRALVRIPGTSPIEVVSIHPTAPIKPGTTIAWDHDYESMPAAFSANHPLVLAGDFNATLDHENLRDLIGTGYRDAGDVTGQGFVPTWPSRPTLTLTRISLPVTIDHVLAEQGIAFSEYGVEEIPGSDHRAVFAELIMPPVEGRS